MRALLPMLPALLAGCAVPGTCVGVDLWGAVCPTTLAGVGAEATYEGAWNATRVKEGLEAAGFAAEGVGTFVRGGADGLEAEGRPRGDGWVLWILAEVPPEEVPEDEVRARQDALWEERRARVEEAFAAFEEATGHRRVAFERQDQLLVV